MPPGLPNSKRDAAAAGLPANDAEEQAVQTFTLDVSAGHRRGGASRSEQGPPKKGRGLATPALKASKPAAPAPAALSPEPTKPIKPNAPAAKHAHSILEHAEAASRTATPPWLVSLGLHAAVLLVLSFCTLATLQQEDLGLWASSVPREEIIEEFPELVIDPSVELDDLETELPTELDDPGLSSLGDLSAETALAEVSTNASLPTGDLGELGTLFGDQGNALSDLGAGEGGATTTFFGTKSRARRIVFVIDNTGSMNYGGLETVIDELLKSVNAMDDRQQFYVFFFSDQVYPLFFPQSRLTYARANDENKRMLQAWLDSVELCTGGVWQLTQALEAAFAMKPDVIYLLCDGRDWDRVRASYKVEAVKRLKSEGNPHRIPVHTLGMGCKDQSDRENLTSVARANSGTFREVQVTAALVEVARQRNRPYHLNGPGAIWGSEVQIRRTQGEEQQGQQ
jgi:hypothetical protein